jgi:hypothetical protein
LRMSAPTPPAVIESCDIASAVEVQVVLSLNQALIMNPLLRIAASLVRADEGQKVGRVWQTQAMSLYITS